MGNIFTKSVLIFFMCVGAMFSLCGDQPLHDHDSLPYKLPENLFFVKRPVNLTDFIPPELRQLAYGIYPKSPEYNTARLIFNKRFVYFPKAIFVPTTFQEVQYLIGVLRQYHLPFAIQSGGHCIEPGSLSSYYVISLKNFNSIIPDITTGQVYIGAGAKLETVIHTLGLIDYAIPTGTCPSVGVAGLTLGGGLGLLSRIYGLTCDSVQSITFVNADSEIIEVSATNYPDLFWALRGGGNGSYGIALGFTFNMHYIPVVTYYELMWNYDPYLIPDIMVTWQKWVKDLPEIISSDLAIRHPSHLTSRPEESPPLTIRIFGLKVGSEPFTEWEDAFESLHPSVFIRSGSYLEMSKFWAKESDLPFLKYKSRILMKPLTLNAIMDITRFFKRLERRDPNYLVYFEFERFGGQVPNNHTAFFPRHAFGWWAQAYFWPEQKQSEEVLALSRRFYASIPKEVSRYCYANLVDYDLGKHYLKDYYGNHVDRLIRIKRKYDPTNLFHWKQSIPLKRHLNSYSFRK